MLGQENVIVDIIYRWSRAVSAKKENGGSHEVDAKEVNAVRAENWQRLHGDHTRLSTRMHQCKKVRLSCSQK